MPSATELQYKSGAINSSGFVRFVLAISVPSFQLFCPNPVGGRAHVRTPVRVKMCNNAKPLFLLSFEQCVISITPMLRNLAISIACSPQVIYMPFSVLKPKRSIWTIFPPIIRSLNALITAPDLCCFNMDGSVVL